MMYHPDIPDGSGELTRVDAQGWGYLISMFFAGVGTTITAIFGGILLLRTSAIKESQTAIKTKQEETKVMVDGNFSELKATNVTLTAEVARLNAAALNKSEAREIPAPLLAPGALDPQEY